MVLVLGGRLLIGGRDYTCFNDCFGIAHAVIIYTVTWCVTVRVCLHAHMRTYIPIWRCAIVKVFLANRTSWRLHRQRCRSSLTL